MVEVETFRHHLSTNQDISTPGRKVADNAFVGITRTGGIKIHTRDTRLGKYLAHLFLDLLCTEAARTQVGTATARTLRWHTIGIAAIVTRQLIHLPMICQRYITMLARGHPSALMALYDRGKTASVLKQNSLFAMFQCLAHTR